jgi:hypothetical protein
MLCSRRARGRPRTRLPCEFASHDLFQLYWSRSSAHSPQVEEEWQLALQVAASKPAAEFVRPVYWTIPMPEPPKALAPLHFRYLDPQPLGIGKATGLDPRRQQTQAAAEIEVTFPVIAYADDPGGATTARIRQALRSVVPHLERLTGLRYYPPPTLLVDEHLVAALRRSSEIDWHDDADRGDQDTAGEEGEDTRVITELFRSLALIFHTGAYLGPDSYEVRKQFENRLQAGDHDDYRHIRRNAEGGISAMTSDFLNGIDPLSKHGQFEQIVREVQDDLDSDSSFVATWKITDEMERLLAVSGPQGHGKVMN